MSTALSPLTLWQQLTIGFIFIAFILQLFLYLFIRKKIKKNKYQILFFCILSLYITIYLLNPTFWNTIIRTVYEEFRFILYLDVGIIVLVPTLYSILVKNTQFLKNSANSINDKLLHINNFLRNFNIRAFNLFNKLILQLGGKKKQLKKKISISTIVNCLILISLLFYSVLRAIPNYNKRYYRKFFEESWYKSYTNALLFLDSITLGHETYMYSTFTPYTHLWSNVHTYMGDLRCIDPNQMELYFYDTLYQSNNSNYQKFLNFVFNETKFINKYQANYKDLPIFLRITKTVDYIIIESFANPNLCELMLNDTTHFTKIFQSRIINYVYLLASLGEEIFVYVFKTNE
jgi:hypothetical protein